MACQLCGNLKMVTQLQPFLSLNSTSVTHLQNLIQDYLSMRQILDGFVSKAFRVQIQGNIDQKLADSVFRGLQNSWPYRPTALLVTINSPGGSIVQAKNISDQLKLFSNRYNIPIVTFVQDQCLNSANIILTSGVKCYANAFSMIGDIGFVWSNLWFNRFANKYDIKQQFVYSPENKVKFNRFQQIKPQSQKWAKNYIYSMEHELKTVITNNRSEHFVKKGLTKQTLQSSLFSQGILDPEQLVSLGFLDGIRNLDHEIKQKYSGVAIREVNKPSRGWRQRLSASYSFS